MSRVSKYSCSSRGECEVDSRGEYNDNEECIAYCNAWENRDVTLLAYQYDLEAALQDLTPSDLASLVYIVIGEVVDNDRAYDRLSSYVKKLPFTYSYKIRGDDPLFVPYTDYIHGFSEVMLLSPDKDYTLVPSRESFIELRGDAIYIGLVSRWGREVKSLYPDGTVYVMTTAADDINHAITTGKAIPLTMQQALMEIEKAESIAVADYIFYQKDGNKDWEYIKTLPQPGLDITIS